MKTIIAALLIFVSGIVCAQESSTIYFVTHKKIGSLPIYLNEQMIGTINTGENLQYKIYSEGRITVFLLSPTSRITKTLDIKRGGTYYFEINWWNQRFGLTTEEKGKEYFAENANTLKAEEDLKHPINPNSASEDDGPKQGTCFLVSKKGYLITNYHVISGAKSIQVKGIGGDFSTLYGVDVVAT